MRNLAPTRALARRTRQLIALALVIGAIGAFIVAISIVMYIIPIVGTSSPDFGVYNFVRGAVLAFGSLLLVICVALIIRALTWRTDNDLAVQLGEAMTAQFDKRFTLIRNVSKRELGYIDAILVGPPGALVFRILDEKGIFANEGPNWLKQNKNGDWSPWATSPTKQVVADIQKLRNLFAAQNLSDVPVYGMIVFTHPEPAVQLKAKSPVVPMTHMHSLYTNLQDNYLAKDRIDATRVQMTVRSLYES
jgi:Nuclease-related domain